MRRLRLSPAESLQEQFRLGRVKHFLDIEPYQNGVIFPVLLETSITTGNLWPSGCPMQGKSTNKSWCKNSTCIDKAGENVENSPVAAIFVAVEHRYPAGIQQKVIMNWWILEPLIHWPPHGLHHWHETWGWASGKFTLATADFEALFGCASPFSQLTMLTGVCSPSLQGVIFYGYIPVVTLQR